MSKEGRLEIAHELLRNFEEYNKHGGKTKISNQIAVKLSDMESHDNPAKKMFPGVSDLNYFSIQMLCHFLPVLACLCEPGCQH